MQQRKPKILGPKILGIVELLNKFPTDTSAIKHLESIIWKNGLYCKRCKATDKLTKQKDGHNYWCKTCRKYLNVMTNTPMERSNLGMRNWIIAIYMMMTARKSISSLQLSKELSITQKSSWFMCQRIRDCFNIEKGDKLEGVVKVDEVYIGGLEKNKHKNKKTKGTTGRSTKTKTAVVGIKQRNGEIRVKVMNEITKTNIKQFINDNVKHGSTIFTDKATHYNQRPYYDREADLYNWNKVDHGKEEWVRGDVHTNSIESVWAIMKRSHKMSRKHLQKYINEVAFRLNQGNVGVDTIDRINAMIKYSVGKRLTYKEFIK